MPGRLRLVVGVSSTDCCTGARAPCVARGASLTRVASVLVPPALQPMRRGAGVLSHSYTSPSNPLYIQQPHIHRPHTPTPQEMAAALAAMELSHSAGAPTPPATAAAPAAAPEPAAEAASTAPCSSGKSFSSTATGADSGATTPSAASDGEADAVAVVADMVGDTAVPTHLKCHLETSHLAPVQPEPVPRHTPCQTATQVSAEGVVCRHTLFRSHKAAQARSSPTQQYAQLGGSQRLQHKCRTAPTAPGLRAAPLPCYCEQ